MEALFQQRNPIVDRKIRLALVGCGRISHKHFEAVRQHAKSVELVAICDNNRDLLETASGQFKVQGYASLDTLLEKSDADIVVLATPSGLHAEQVIQIA